MSHRLDLDEMETDKLLAEIGRRVESAAEGRCCYCNRPVESSACKFPDRHDSSQSGAATRLKRVNRLNVLAGELCKLFGAARLARDAARDAAKVEPLAKAYGGKAVGPARDKSVWDFCVDPDKLVEEGEVWIYAQGSDAPAAVAHSWDEAITVCNAVNRVLYPELSPMTLAGFYEQRPKAREATIDREVLRLLRGRADACDAVSVFKTCQALPGTVGLYPSLDSVSASLRRLGNAGRAVGEHTEGGWLWTAAPPEREEARPAGSKAEEATPDQAEAARLAWVAQAALTAAGMTAEEAKVLDLTADAWNLFNDLPTLHGSHRQEVCEALHRVQWLVFARPTYRAYLEAQRK